MWAGSNFKPSAAARGKKGIRPSPRSRPPPAAIRADGTPVSSATTPHSSAPTANDPNRVSVDTASARPRTHSAAPRCAARIRLDTTMSQPVPATSIAPSRTPNSRTHASARHPTANTTVATAVITSVDWRLRHTGKIAAPSSPPRPRLPTRAPYAMGPRPNDVFATSGSSDQSALANSTNAAVRTMTARNAGVYRT